MYTDNTYGSTTDCSIIKITTTGSIGGNGFLAGDIIGSSIIEIY